MLKELISSRRRGFSLVELLIVLAIISVLSVIVIASINPTKNLADTRNAQRESDVGVIMNAVHQYQLDKGYLPTTLPIVSMKQICKTGASCTGGVSLDMLSTVTGSYLVGIPVDPLASSSGTGTQYWIAKDTKGRVTVIAAFAERNKNIFLTR